MIKKYVFGYGTLRSDVPLSSVPSFLKSIGKGTIKAQLWKITNRYNYGPYKFWAGVTLDKTQKTVGEIFEVTNKEKGWKNLDARECINEKMYNKETVTATLENGKKVEVEVYCTGENSTKEEEIKSGDWKRVLEGKE